MPSKFSVILRPDARSLGGTALARTAMPRNYPTKPASYGIRSVLDGETRAQCFDRTHTDAARNLL